MNRDFEFQQLLRAYRAGIISEQTFEAEMASLESTVNGTVNSSGGFQAFGKTYSSEREAIVTFLDRARVAESNAGLAFNNWANACKTDCIRSGLRMIAEREGYHGRLFEQRLAELGAECKAVVTEESRKFGETVSDPNLADNEKLLRFNALVRDPEAATKPICEFAESLKEDLQTKEMLKLFYEDELSSTRWLRYACEVLNAPAQQPSQMAQPSMAQPSA
jgi:Mn-containing catalase